MTSMGESLLHAGQVPTVWCQVLGRLSYDRSSGGHFCIGTTPVDTTVFVCLCACSSGFPPRSTASGLPANGHRHNVIPSLSLDKGPTTNIRVSMPLPSLPQGPSTIPTSDSVFSASVPPQFLVMRCFSSPLVFFFVFLPPFFSFFVFFLVFCGCWVFLCVCVCVCVFVCVCCLTFVCFRRCLFPVVFLSFCAPVHKHLFPTSFGFDCFFCFFFFVAFLVVFFGGFCGHVVIRCWCHHSAFFAYGSFFCVFFVFLVVFLVFLVFVSVFVCCLLFPPPSLVAGFCRCLVTGFGVVFSETVSFGFNGRFYRFLVTFGLNGQLPLVGNRFWGCFAKTVSFGFNGPFYGFWAHVASTGSLRSN